MTFPPRFMDDLRTRLTLSDLIGRRVKLTRAGREWRACCPFHKEKSPSFYVNDDKQFFHCFGCGAHGDVIGFTMRYDNLSFPEAVETLASQAGLEVPKSEPIDAAQAEKDKAYYTAMEAASRWFEEQLLAPKNRDVLAYLTGRGLSPDKVAGFRLGYAPAGDRGLYQHLAASGVREDVMIDMGLVKRREADGQIYDFFRDRVMFPVADRGGRIVAFGGRILPDHLRPPARGDFKPPKYLNSPETPLFHKGSIVYAYSLARTAVTSGAPVVVVEGYMDVIACHQAGVTGAVAPLGTALTEGQIELLWKMIPSQEKIITLCFDGDSAGQKAAWRAAERMLPLLRPDHSARIVFLPEGEDPDTLLQKQGLMAFQTVLSAGMGLADYIWKIKTETHGYRGPEGRAGLEKELEKLYLTIKDEKIKYHYKSFFREKMNALFRPAPRPFMKGGYVKPMPLRPSARPGLHATARTIDILIAALLNHPAIFGEVDEMMGLIPIDDPAKDAIRQALIEILSTHDHMDSAALLTYLATHHPDVMGAVQVILSDQVLVHAAFARPGVEDIVAAEGFKDAYHQLLKHHAARTGS